MALDPKPVEDVYNLLPEECRKRIDRYGLWNYRLYGPVSLDDPPVITIFLTYGKKRAERTDKVTMTMRDKVESQVELYDSGGKDVLSHTR